MHIIGTNGKGSTGRFLSYYLYKIGKSVGHYSSPHILNFNERIWLNGFDIDDKTVDIYHYKLQATLPQYFLKKLSYFEYTTILAFYIFSKEDIYYWIIEAGLGGEFDATNVITKNLSLITKIDIDHQEFLGNTIEKIATTKINSIKNDAIIADKQDIEVIKIANRYLKNINKNLFTTNNYIDKKETNHINKLLLTNFLKDNLRLAISALKYMGIKDIKLEYLNSTPLVARAQKISQNITIDVGHNKLAAKEIKKLFSNKKIVLVYNCYKDKDYKQILKILLPITKRLEIIEIKDDRIIDPKLLIKYAQNLGLKVSFYTKTNKKDEYLFFGSFKVVELYFKKSIKQTMPLSNHISIT